MRSTLGNRPCGIVFSLALAAGLAVGGGPPPGPPDVRAVVRQRGKAVVKIETREYFIPGLLRRVGRVLNPFPLRSTLADAASLAFFLPSGAFHRLRRHIGSGVVIEPDGHLLTNHHVVRGADHITVRLTDAAEVRRQFRGRVVGADRLSDVALVKIDPAEARLVVAPLGDSDALELGDWVIAIGQPLNLTGTVTVGVVSGRHRQLDSAELEDYIQTDAAVNPGNSGGPILDAQGRVVGLVTLGIFPADNIGFAVPTALIAPFLDDLKADGRPRRGYLGLSVEDITPHLAKRRALDRDSGVLVTRIRAFSPAGKAGFHRGDVVVSIDGRTVAKARDVQMLVLRTKPGSTVPVVVRRKGKLHTLHPTLRERRKPFRIF